MRGRLFWKIVISFWLTFLLIIECVWLMTTLVRPGPSDATRSLARISLGASQEAIKLGGLPMLHRQISNWPRDERGRVSVTPVDADAAPRRHPLGTEFSAIAVDPAGQHYSVMYNVTRFRGYGQGPLDMPRRMMLIALFGSLGFAAILAWYLTAPVHKLRRAFARLSAGDLTARLGGEIGKRRDEIADLARDFDDMAEHLEELVGARDRLISDVSHELRSPLARLQLAIGLARQGNTRVETCLDRISREASILDELVGELLTLARMEANVQLADDYFDISEVVRLVAGNAKFEAQSLDVEVETELPDVLDMGYLVRGSGKMVSRAIENIVRNAIRFSPRGRKVSIKLTAEGSNFIITVLDEGPGIAADKLPKLFEPLAHGPSGDGKGYGLGLAIARRALTAHGGSVEAYNRSHGGLAMAVTLPAAAVSPP